MENANLKGADLSYAIIDEAIFKNANLEGAILTEATLVGIKLSEVDLRNTVGLTWEQITSARYNATNGITATRA
jgi:uncharacterized protein YjbI with pentapeptide repeats